MRQNRSLENDIDLDTVYRAAHLQVFGTDPGSVGLQRQEHELKRAAKKLKLKPEQFILVAMAGHAMTWPDQAFTLTHLLRMAPKRVRVWVDACRTTYGSLDVVALDKITGRQDSAYDLKRRMLRCEKIAGHWIIQFKLENEGTPFEPFFEAEQLNLDSSWLAIEPHYESRILDRSRRLCGRQGVNELLYEVAGAFKQMKRRPKIALASFHARETIMAEAVDSVLYKYRLSADDLLLKQDTVTDPLKMWYWIGLAIQHREVFQVYTSREK